jgi:hypothetical protein
MEQDPTHPTGVRETAASSQSGTARARREKAAMATKLYVDDHKTLKFVARKCGYPTATSALRAIEGHMANELKEHPKSQAMMRDMASRRLEMLSRSAWKKATDPNDPEHLAANARAQSVVMDWVRLNGLAAPTQLVISNPTTEMIEEMATKILSVGAKPVEEGDIFGDDADDSEILALEAKRADVVDAEIVEETA